MKSVVPAILILAAYALGLLWIGGITWYVAPPGANATTALIVSGAGAAGAVVCIVLLLQTERSRARALLGFYLGLFVLIVMGVGAGMRLKGSLGRTSEFNQEVRRGSVTVVTQTRENKDSPIHPVAYQAVGIAATVALSAFAFIVLLTQKPKYAVPVEPGIIPTDPARTTASMSAPGGPAGA